MKTKLTFSLILICTVILISACGKGDSSSSGSKADSASMGKQAKCQAIVDYSYSLNKKKNPKLPAMPDSVKKVAVDVCMKNTDKLVDKQYKTMKAAQ